MMEQFWNDLALIIYGAAFGYFWHPVWTIAKKIWTEAKKARDEW